MLTEEEEERTARRRGEELFYCQQLIDVYAADKPIFFMYPDFV